MNYATIKKFDIANGPGIRVTIFVSGCNHHCSGCFNEEAWDFNYGNEFNESVIKEILEGMAPEHITGITFLGGEPMDPRNQEEVNDLINRVKETYPNKDIWLYSGYVIDDFKISNRAYTKYTKNILENLDVLVDGPFVSDLKDITLRFKGSSNQRLIDMKETIKQNKVVLYKGLDFYNK